MRSASQSQSRDPSLPRTAQTRRAKRGLLSRVRRYNGRLLLSQAPDGGLTVFPSNIHAGRQRVGLDELAARLDDVTHQAREDLVRFAQIAELHLQQRAHVPVEGRLPQLLGVHLAQTLVALHGDALAPRI